MSRVVSILTLEERLQARELFQVPVLVGAAEELVTLRTKATVYRVNRPLRYWATWFLLKSITTSGKISCWNQQKQTLLNYLRLSDGTFRRQLNELKALGLLRLEEVTGKRDKHIVLTSYKDAAHIMGIQYKGETVITYQPHTYANESQVFRYLLVAHEVECNQQLQLGELYRKFQNNLSGYATEILSALSHVGADVSQVQRSAAAFQKALLQLQKTVFRDRSGLASVAFSLRADINRSCTTWASHHGYAHGQSASFLKHKLQKLGVASVTKTFVRSKERSRLYVPGSAGERRDGYKWVKGCKQTLWVLCDQVSVKLNPEAPAPGTNQRQAA